MIENKLVTIKKDNTFNKGWALFEKYNIPIVNTLETGVKKVTSEEIVQNITFSNSVDIILKDPCLSSNIVSELQWVSNRGVKLRILAQNQEIIDKYSALNFTQAKVNPNISVNYLAIFGEKPFYVTISDYYISTDGAIWILLFGTTNGNSWQILDGATRVVIVEQQLTSIYEPYFAECIRRQIPVDYVVPVDKFTEALCKRIPKEVNLCVTDNAKPALLIFGKYYAYTKESVRFFCGDLYRNLRLEDNISLEKVRAGVFSCSDGKLKPFLLEDTKVIERTVQVDLMSDFVMEHFDCSETEKHNDYSAEFKSVEYRFNLVPPKFNSTYTLSDIYTPIKELYSRWANIQQYKLREVLTNLKEIIPQCDLLNLLNNILQFEKWFKIAVAEYKYCGYRDKVDKLKQSLTDAVDRYQQYFERIFVIINGSMSSSKFDKLDADIQGYRDTIQEKTQLIQQGKNVLGNRQRIEQLELQIAQLEKIKQNFESKSASLINKALEEYQSNCAKILSGVQTENVGDSIGNVIHQNKSKSDLFEIFTVNYLSSLRNYLQELLTVVEEMSQQDIPEDYAVYDRGGEHYIVIDSLSEYETTLLIQDKYKLKCLAR